MTNEQLAILAKKGNKNAYEQLYKKCLNLLRHAVNKMNPRINSNDFEDMLSEANLMFCRAVKNWKPEKGAKFKTYLYHALYKSDSYKSERYFYMSPIRTPLSQEMHEILSLDYLTGDNEDETFSDIIAGKDCMQESFNYLIGLETLSHIGEKLQKNADLERRLDYIYRTIEGYLPKELAERWGVNESRVTQIKNWVFQELERIHHEQY